MELDCRTTRLHTSRPAEKRRHREWLYVILALAFMSVIAAKAISDGWR